MNTRVDGPRGFLSRTRDLGCKVRSVADMVQRTGPERLVLKSDQEPSLLDLKSKAVAELGGSHDLS